MGSPGARLRTIQEYELLLNGLDKDYAALKAAARRARQAAIRMYWGPEDDETISVVGDEDSDQVSPRKSYECHRDSIRLRLLAIDCELKINKEQRCAINDGFGMANKRAVVEAAETDNESIRLLKGGKVAAQARDAN